MKEKESGLDKELLCELLIDSTNVNEGLFGIIIGFITGLELNELWGYDTTKLINNKGKYDLEEVKNFKQYISQHILEDHNLRQQKYQEQDNQTENQNLDNVIYVDFTKNNREEV